MGGAEAQTYESAPEWPSLYLCGNLFLSNAGISVSSELQTVCFGQQLSV